MGTMIQLSVGNLEIDWGKNESFIDHSAIYQTSDLATVPSWYVKDNDSNHSNDTWELYADYQEGLTAPINKVAERLRLLGFTLAFCERQYNYQLDDDSIEENNGLNISFEELKHIFSTINVEIFLDDKVKIHRDIDKELNELVIKEVISLRNGLKPAFIEFFGGSSEESLHPYTIINLLSLNPSALKVPVNWDFAGLVENGWAKREDFVKALDKSNRFLIVTEGSSDAAIIRHAFHLLKPHISDFFDYVDMKEGYPFSGTGNLVNFVKGLISIGVYNNVIVLFDNDAEGIASFKRCNELNIPKNMKILKLQTYVNLKTLTPWDLMAFTRQILTKKELLLNAI
jgi:hypothetical protein